MQCVRGTFLNLLSRVMRSLIHRQHSLYSLSSSHTSQDNNEDDQDKASQGQAALHARTFLTQLVDAAASDDAAKLDSLLQEEKDRHPDLEDDSAAILRQYKDGNGRTALHFACHAGQVEMVRHILDLAPEGVSWEDDKGDTPLILAAAGGGDGNTSRVSRKDLLEVLLDRGADPNHGPVKDDEHDGARALHHVAGHDDVEAVRTLLRHGSDVNAAAGTGTPLHWASAEGAKASLEALIETGGDVDAVNDQGLSPIILAAAHGCGGCVALLAKGGADVGFILSGAGLTALHMMAEYGSLDGVQAILATGAPGVACAVQESENGKPIHLAAWAAHKDVVETLLPYSDVKETVEELMSWGRARAAAYEEEKGRSSDHTMLQPEQDSRHSSGVHLPPPAASAADVETALRLKETANRHYVAGEYGQALPLYDESIGLNGRDSALWSNRSGCLLKLGRPEDALRDAETARALKPGWPKACFRMAEARLALKRYEDAALAAYEGIQLDSGNQALHNILKTAIELGRAEHQKKVKEREGR